MDGLENLSLKVPLWGALSEGLAKSTRISSDVHDFIGRQVRLGGAPAAN